MRTGIVVTGIIILILGMFLSLMWYPMFGYASASETAAELEDFDFNIASFNGKDVKFSGTVDEIYTDDIPGVDFLFELIDISIITIVDLEVDTLLGGSAPVFIICDNTDISDGDTVIIEGTGINYGGFSLIFGEDVANAVLKLSSYRAPDPATVKSIPMPEFYIGIVILIVGLIIAIIGEVLKKKPKPQASPQQPYQQQPYQPPPSRDYQPPPPSRDHRPPPPPPPRERPPPRDYEAYPGPPRDAYQPPPPPRERPPPLPPPPRQQSYPCNYCRKPMRYVNEYRMWYCDYCRRYA